MFKVTELRFHLNVYLKVPGNYVHKLVYSFVVGLICLNKVMDYTCVNQCLTRCNTSIWTVGPLWTLDIVTRDYKMRPYYHLASVHLGRSWLVK